MPLPQHCHVTFSRLSLSIPLAGRFFTEGNLQSGFKVATGKLTEVQYHLKVLTPLLWHWRMTFSQLYLSIPLAGRFFTEENLQSGSKVAAGKLTEGNENAAVVFSM